MLFKEVIGQENIKNKLLHAVQEGRIPHAQLFLGPEGSGNLALALSYVQYLLCKDRSEVDACGVCDSCRKVGTFNHPDVHFSYPVLLSKSTRTAEDEIENWRKSLNENVYLTENQWYHHLGSENKQGVIGTEESQRIIKRLSLKSFEGGYKFLIMWLPENMNTVCANKLLKEIEEPPEKTVLILVSHEQEQLLPTILSRTQIVKIPHIEQEEIEKALQSGFQISKEEAHSIGALCEGNFFQALKLLQEKDLENKMLGLFREWMLACYQTNVKGMLSFADKAHALGREGQKSFLKYALHLFRQCFIPEYTKQQLLRLKGEELEFWKKFSRFVTHNNILMIYESLNEASYHIERNGYAKLIFTDLSFEIMRAFKRK